MFDNGIIFSLFGQLCHDDTPMVRRAAATHLKVCHYLNELLFSDSTQNSLLLLLLLLLL
jgi:hypothetical protein